MNAKLMPEHAPDCEWTLHKWTCSCDHPEYLQAVEDLASEVIRACVDWALGDCVEWADYPLLPENVWADVQREARRLACGVDYGESYNRFAELAVNDA